MTIVLLAEAVWCGVRNQTYLALDEASHVVVVVEGKYNRVGEDFDTVGAGDGGATVVILVDDLVGMDVVEMVHVIEKKSAVGEKLLTFRANCCDFNIIVILQRFFVFC